MASGNRDLDGFIAKYDGSIAALTHSLFQRMRKRMPNATVLVYDNYNALAIGFASGDKVGNVILSITPYPRWISLFFMYGTSLPDPHGLLVGKGSQVRSLRLAGTHTLDDPRVDALIADAICNANSPLNSANEGAIVIKSISAKQRPRRPGS